MQIRDMDMLNISYYMLHVTYSIYSLVCKKVENLSGYIVGYMTRHSTIYHNQPVFKMFTFLQVNYS